MYLPYKVVAPPVHSAFSMTLLFSIQECYWVWGETPMVLLAQGRLSQ